MGNSTNAELDNSKLDIMLYDVGTGEEYRITVSKQRVTMWSTEPVTVWSTVKEEFSKRYRNVKNITYGGREISETETWEQLGIADDATVMAETDHQEP